MRASKAKDKLLNALKDKVRNLSPTQLIVQYTFQHEDCHDPGLLCHNDVCDVRNGVWMVHHSWRRGGVQHQVSQLRG